MLGSVLACFDVWDGLISTLAFGFRIVCIDLYQFDGQWVFLFVDEMHLMVQSQPDNKPETVEDLERKKKKEEKVLLPFCLLLIQLLCSFSPLLLSVLCNGLPMDSD